VTSLLLHLIACVLVWHLAATVPGANPLGSLLALAFFVLAPIHDEPVAWISARGHIMAPIFILGTLLLVRHFEQHGGRMSYLAGFGCALAAFATQEVAATLPPLLLFRDLADAPKIDRAWLRRMLVIHAPFWLLFAGYLGLRYTLFGQLARDSTPTSIPALLYSECLALWTLWLSPGTRPNLFSPFINQLVRVALYLLVPVLLVTAFLWLPAAKRAPYARGVLFFAVIWPIVCTAVLFGAHSPRHLYLASIGVAIALGLAGAALLRSRRLAAAVGAVVIAALLGICGVGLMSNVAMYARNGERSRALATHVAGVLADAARDHAALVIVIPKFPNSQVVFWDYFYPHALSPPFTSTAPANVLPSFESCHCLPEEWKTENAATLALLRDPKTGPIYVIQWDADQSTYVTRVISQPAFWQGEYVSPSGPLLMPRFPGLPGATLP
jgi:hypothetical protein